MLVFKKGWNRRELWKKSAWKMVKFTISGQISETCTGTGLSCTGTSSVLFFCFDQR